MNDKKRTLSFNPQQVKRRAIWKSMASCLLPGVSTTSVVLEALETEGKGKEKEAEESVAGRGKEFEKKKGKERASDEMEENVGKEKLKPLMVEEAVKSEESKEMTGTLSHSMK